MWTQGSYDVYSPGRTLTLPAKQPSQPLPLHAVATKLGMLMAPYLKRWTFTRQQEQIQGAQKFRPPRVDINAPDLYVPLMAAWAYVILVLANAALLGKYKPDMMYSTVGARARRLP